VEASVLKHYSERGWTGSHDEGQLFQRLLRAICADAVSEFIPECADYLARHFVDSFAGDLRYSIAITEYRLNGKPLDGRYVLYDADERPFPREERKTHAMLLEDMKGTLDMLSREDMSYGSRGVPPMHMLEQAGIRYIALADDSNNIQDHKKRKLIDAVEKASKGELIDTLDRLSVYTVDDKLIRDPATGICSDQNSLVSYSIDEKYIKDPFLSDNSNRGMLIQMFENLGKATILKMAKAYFSGELLDIGWPDLTLLRDTEIVFVEVKAKDKLHYSQIKTLDILRGCIDRLGVLVAGNGRGKLRQR